jgi:hypothetical protein
MNTREAAMTAILTILAPIFIVLAAGYVLHRCGLFTDQYVEQSNQLIFYVFLPLLLFHKISQSDFESLFSPGNLLVMVTAIGAVFLLSWIWGGLAHYPPSILSTFINDNFRSNFVYIGLPVCYYALGDGGLAIGSVLTALAVPVVNILSVLAFSPVQNQHFNLRLFLLDLVKNPLIIGAASGIMFSLLEVPIPDFIAEALLLLTQLTLPLALCCIGASLSLAIKPEHWPVLASSSLFKLFLLPLIAYGLMAALRLPLDTTAKALLIMLAAPSAEINYTLAAQMNGEADLAGTTIVITTILSAFSYLIWLSLLNI